MASFIAIWTVLPGSATTPCSNGMWRAEFFKNTTLSGTPAGVQCTAAINRDWDTDGPSYPGMVDNFSVRYTKVDTYAAGTHRFSTVSDDGVRVVVDPGTASAHTVIDNWTDHARTSDSGSVALPAGTHTVVVNFYQRVGRATLKVDHTAPAVAESTPVHALYVAPNGSTSNPGTAAAPLRSIQSCLDRVQPGDTCLIRGGTYQESLVLKRSGTPAARITLQNYNHETVTVSSGTGYALRTGGGKSYYTIDGLRLVSSFVKGRWPAGSVNLADGNASTTNNENILRNCYVSGMIQVYGHHNLVENCELDGSQTWENGIMDAFQESHDNTFRNNNVHGFRNRGIWSMKQTDHTLIEGNAIHDIGPAADGDTSMGVDCDGADRSPTYCTVRGNTIGHVTSFGIQMENALGGVVESNVIHDTGYEAVVWINYRDQQIGGITRNNVVYQAGAGILVGASDVKVYNNSLYSITHAGVRIAKWWGGGCTNHHDVANNILVNVAGSGIIFSDGCSFDATTLARHNLYSSTKAPTLSRETGSRTADPSFTDPGRADFRLQSGSPARGAGDALNDVPRDITGAARRNPPSIGAYE